MRSLAQSLDEICERHRCVQRVPADTELPTNPQPYEAVAVHAGDCSIAASLAIALPKIRGGFEIVEIYVRPRSLADHPSQFEPLIAEHLAADGEWVVVARARHPTDLPRIVGIMLAKDEADVIPDVIANLSKSLDALYYFAGDVATDQAISSSASWARRVDINALHTDGLRQFLLQQARFEAPADDPRPTWVMVVQGDEIYHDDVRLHVQLAQQERATVMTCQVATFLLHETQREGWDWQQPLNKRLTHYIWDFGEHAGFLDFPWIYYNPQEHMRAHPHGIYPAKWAAARPVRKHYPFRSPEQARARIEDRLKSGWQPHYENYRDIFVDEAAAGRPVKVYHGWFGEAERTEGIW